MSTVTVNSKYSFIELAKRLAPGQKSMQDIAEVMTLKNEMLLDIPWFQCNQILSERVTRRTSLPSGTMRQAYKGVVSQASTTQVDVEPVALIEDRSEIDEAIVDNAPSGNELRRQEDVAFTEGLAQTCAQKILYGTTVGGNADEINGLAPRLDELSQTTVMDGGHDASNDCTSIFVVDWGRLKTYGIYPSAAAQRGTLGLSIVNKGKEPIGDGGTPEGTYYAYVTQFKWWIGLAVRDQRAIGRYCNIDPTIGGANSFDEDKLIELLNEGQFAPATTRIYISKKVKTQMQIRAKDKGNIQWGPVEGLSGRRPLMFLDSPIRMMESIKDDENPIS